MTKSDIVREAESFLRDKGLTIDASRAATQRACELATKRELSELILRFCLEAVWQSARESVTDFHKPRGKQ